MLHETIFETKSINEFCAQNDNEGRGYVGNDGFGANSTRGTGHLFSAHALDAFLRRNSFSHLVRDLNPQPSTLNPQLSTLNP